MDPTAPSLFYMYALMALFAVGALFFLVKALRSGAVSGDESPKFRMLEDDVLRPFDGGTHGRKP